MCPHWGTCEGDMKGGHIVTTQGWQMRTCGHSAAGVPFEVGTLTSSHPHPGYGLEERYGPSGNPTVRTCICCFGHWCGLSPSASVSWTVALTPRLDLGSVCLMCLCPVGDYAGQAAWILLGGPAPLGVTSHNAECEWPKSPFHLAAGCPAPVPFTAAS